MGWELALHGLTHSRRTRCALRHATRVCDIHAVAVYQLTVEIPALNVTLASGYDDRFVIRVGSAYEEEFFEYTAPLTIVRTIEPEASDSVRVEIELLVAPNNVGPLLSRVVLERTDIVTPVETATWGRVKALYRQ